MEVESAKIGKQMKLGKSLVIIGVIIMTISAIAEFIYGGNAFIASEILGLGLSQIGIVLWSTNLLLNQIADSRNLILREMKERGKNEDSG